MFVFFWIFSKIIYLDPLFISFGFPYHSNFIGLVLFLQVYVPLGYSLSIFFNWYTRSLEYQADKFSKNQGFGEDLCRGLIKIYVENAGNLNPDSFYGLIHFSHPQLVERLRALEFSGMKAE